MGEQASGKSTVAKSVYFFSTIKDDICDALLKNQSLKSEELKKVLRNKLKRLFGTILENKDGMQLECFYSDDIFIKINIPQKDYLQEKIINYINDIDDTKIITIINYYENLKNILQNIDTSVLPNNIHKYNNIDKNNLIESIKSINENIDFWNKVNKSQNKQELITSAIDKLYSPEVEITFCTQIEDKLTQNGFTGDKDTLQKQLDEFFQDEYKTVFIPAGRCLEAQMSRQLSYIYASMGDELKNGLDYTTQKFIEMVFLCRIALKNGIEGFSTLSSLWIEKIEKLIKGRYVCTSDDEERLYLPDEPLQGGKYILFHLASSGQQEVAWLLNIIAYYLDAYNRTGGKTMFIIEEPETHLYPTAQKELMEIIAFIANQLQSFFITTHSPYVLGSLNNLLYAANQPKRLKKKIAEIIPEKYQLKKIDAFYLKNGGMEPAIDNDMKPLIENGLIDDVSHELNDEIDRMIDLKYRKEQ